MTVRPIRLPDRFYLPRVQGDGTEVRDIVPWEGATSYVTDGERVGLRFRDARVVWLGAAGGVPPDDERAMPPVSFGADFAGVDLDALVSGIREYMERHPVLRSVWHDDLEELDLLRRADDPPGSSPAGQDAA
jgi:hypothetical protein